jgi:hypothetical protein
VCVCVAENNCLAGSMWHFNLCFVSIIKKKKENSADIPTSVYHSIVINITGCLNRPCICFLSQYRDTSFIWATHFMATFWAVFTFGGSGPAITAHGSLDL